MNGDELRRKRMGESLGALWRVAAAGRNMHRGAAWSVIIVGALAAFELLNFSTTEYALHDVLGGLTVARVPWATLLAVAFCGIDFAGIARVFTPGDVNGGAAEIWYLFAAWLLAACFNSALTWWGVSIAILNHAQFGHPSVLGGGTLTTVVPVLVAALVWLVRVLTIGTLSSGGGRVSSTVSAPYPPEKEPVDVFGVFRQQEQADSRV